MSARPRTSTSIRASMENLGAPVSMSIKIDMLTCPPSRYTRPAARNSMDATRYPETSDTHTEEVLNKKRLATSQVIATTRKTVTSRASWKLKSPIFPIALSIVPIPIKTSIIIHMLSEASLKEIGVFCPQLGFDHLAHGVAGQLINHFHSFRYFVTGKVLFAETDDFFRDLFGRRIQHHHGDNGFAKVRVGHTDNGRLLYAGYGIDNQLYLLGIHVVAAGDNKVFTAANDVEVAFVIQPPQIAGFKPAITGELFSCLLRFIPVALHYGRAFDFDSAHVINLRDGPVLSGYPYFNSFDR